MPYVPPMTGECAEEHDEPPGAPPPGFKVTLRFARPPPQALICAASTGSASGRGTIKIANEVSELRRRIDTISKKAARERRQSEALIIDLRQASKQGSRDLYTSLGHMESQLGHVQGAAREQ